MRQLWSGIRYSSVGVMLAGVGSAITGCSAEDAIKALLIWLALALGGGEVLEAPNEPVPAFTFVLGNQGSVDDVAGQCFSSSAAGVIVSNTAPAPVSITKIRLALSHASTVDGTFSVRFAAMENTGGNTWRVDAFQDVSLDWKLVCPNDGVNDCIIDLPAPLSFEAGEALGFKKVSGSSVICASTTTGAAGDTRSKNPCGSFSLTNSCNFTQTALNVLIAGGN